MTYEIELRQVEPQPILSIRGRVPVDAISDSIGEFLSEVYRQATDRGAEPAGPPFTRYHGVGEDEVELEAGLPVSEPTPGEGRVEAGELPGGDVIATDHFGPYDELPAAGEALDAWVHENDRRAAGPSWEIYWTDPGEEDDPSKWRTEVIKPLEPR